MAAQPPHPAQEDIPGAQPARASELYDQGWLTSLLRPLLILVLIACIDVVLGAVMGRFVAGVAGWFAPGLTLLAIGAATAAVVSTSIMSLPSNRINRSAGYQAAEVGLFLAATRLFVWFATGGFPPVQEMLEHPLDILLNPLFVVSAVIVGASWMIAGEVTSDLNQLALTADEIVIATWQSDRNNDPMRASGIDRADVLGSFTLRWVTLGLFLIVLAATVRQGMSFNGFFALLRQNTEPAVMAAIVVYFVVGLLLLSHGRLAMLRSRWTMERTTSSPEVTRRWPLYVALLVGGLALIAALFPFGGTFLLATALSWIIGGIFTVLLILYRLAAWGLLWLFSLFTDEAAPPPPAPLPPTPQAAPPAATPIEPFLPEWFGGALFWVALAVLVIYAALVYFREKGIGIGWLNWLIAMLRRRWQEMTGLLRAGQRLVGGPVPARSGSEGPRAGFWRRRRFRTPEEQVRYLYLATLEEAEAAGVAREPAETPLRYAPRLEKRVTSAPVEEDNGAEPAPRASDESSAETVRALTEAFVDVRYAGRHPDPSLVQWLEQRWQELRRTLQAMRR